jgi:hypothetical protein
MAGINWHVNGNYMETCNCNYVCPCIVTNLAGSPSKGHCEAALFFHIDHGHYANTTLDDLNFVVILYAPGVMAEGNMSVGVIVDERASDEQQEAIVTIASGQAGGPMAGLAPLVTTFLGVERGSFQYEVTGMHHSVTVPGMLEQACEGVPSLGNPDEPLFIDNTAHPASPRLILAKATRSQVSVFERNWSDNSGSNNGHYAPFNWRSS